MLAKNATPEARRASLADELDDLYRRTRAEVGAEDLAHIRKVRAYSRAIEARGRALIAEGQTLDAIHRGVLLRGLHLLLEFSELGHNVMHGGYDHLPEVGEFHSERFRWALAVDPEEWRVMHHLNHHPKTGIVGQDHDMGFSAARLHDGQDWFLHHAVQPLLIGLFLNPAWVFGVYTATSAARVRGDRVLRVETFRRAAALFAEHSRREYVARPLASGSRAPLVALANFASQAIGYDMTALLLIIEHHAPNVEVFADPGPDEDRDAYYERQLRGTTNFTPHAGLEAYLARLLEEEVPFEDRPDFEVFYGGLNTHLEHHLFPDLPCARQRQVQSEVRAICARHGLPYNTMPLDRAVAAVVGRLFPRVGPLGERERWRALLGRPRRLLGRVLDGMRYRNPDPDRYLKRIRTFDASARVVEARPMADGDATLLRLARPRGWESITWAPGAFLSLRVVVDGESLVRQYSLLRQSGPEGGGTMDIAVRRVPGGRVSNHLADHIVAGDRLTIVAPPSAQGGLVQPRVPERAIYLAGGVGITPILSMLRRHARDAPHREATLLYWNRSRRSALFTTELSALAARTGLRIEPFFDDEGAPRISALLLRRHGAAEEGTEIYACAPEGFLNATVDACRSLGIDEARIHLERFHAPEVEKRPLSGRTHRVHFARSGVSVDVDEATTLLEAGRAAGLTLPAGCERGLCRACACTKRGGEALVGDITSKDDERITLCNAFPRGEVALDA